jgi:hypothetical protein
LSIASCNDVKQSTKSLLPTEFKYSAYAWFFNEKVDSFDFFLIHYIDIDKNGHFNIMRRDNWNSRPLYFYGSISDTVRKDIDTILKTNYKSDYTWNVNDGFTYDGYTYTMDFTDDSNKRKLIHYIPNKSPKPITELGILLDTLINTRTGQMLDTLKIDDYTQELKSISWTMTPLPWLRKLHIEKEKFVPPKIPK